MTDTIDRIIGVLAILEIQQVITRNLLEDTPVLTEEVRQVKDVNTQLQGMLRLSPVDRHVTGILEVQLMMPRHLRTATLRILSLAVLQIVIMVDESPEVVTLHVGSIGYTIHGTVVGKVPTVQLLTAGRDIKQVARADGSLLTLVLKI